MRNIYKKLTNETNNIDKINNDYVLYLRPFEFDKKMNNAALILPSILSLSFKTEEEQLGESLKDIGQFKAITNKSDLYILGAEKISIENQKWKNYVMELIRKSRLVVLVAGVSDGIIWELEIAINILPLNKIIILIPDNINYESFCSRVENIFNHPLPQLPINSIFTPCNFAGFIYFNNSYPQFEVFKYRYGFRFHPRMSVFAPLVPVFKMAFKPVYENLLLTWNPAPINWIIFFIYILIFIILIYIDA